LHRLADDAQHEAVEVGRDPIAGGGRRLARLVVVTPDPADMAREDGVALAVVLLDPAPERLGLLREAGRERVAGERVVERAERALPVRARDGIQLEEPLLAAAPDQDGPGLPERRLPAPVLAADRDL